MNEIHKVTSLERLTQATNVRQVVISAVDNLEVGGREQWEGVIFI